MFPFPHTVLCLVHDEKVRDAMERARIHEELARNPRRTAQLSLLRSVLRGCTPVASLSPHHEILKKLRPHQYSYQL